MYVAAKQRLQAFADENPQSQEPGLIYYFALEGRIDLAVATLERWVEARSPYLAFAQILIPSYLGWPDAITGEAGEAYLALLRKLNFPPNKFIE